MEQSIKAIESWHIAQCHICTIAPALRVCNVCPFKAGLEYWNCDCKDDSIRHKSEMFCVRCDTDCPPQIKAL